jgi:uncharacterized protein (TIGR00725 family)
MIQSSRMIPAIAVIGSANARDNGEQNNDAAAQLGVALAKQGVRLVFGVEDSDDHLPDVVYQSFAAAGGEGIGIYRSRDDLYKSAYDLIPVVCGQHRAAGWEAVIVQSAHAVIAIGGGAGTLQEIAIAYQTGIPVVLLRGSGGWADGFARTPVDYRNRDLVRVASTPEEAAALAVAVAASSRRV